MTNLGKIAYEACRTHDASYAAARPWEGLGKSQREIWDVLAHAVFKEVAGWYEDTKTV